jgi:hypothetical protein
MEWRRQDVAYAVATAACCALLGYLVAGNFGLVPSPIGGRPDRSFPIVRVAAAPEVTGAGVAVAPEPDPVLSSLVLPRGADEITPPSRPRLPAAIDTTPPTSAFSTPDGSVLVEEPVTGTVRDTDSNIARVRVTFALAGTASQERDATLSCGDDARSCSWSVRAPLAAGTYTVSVQASDAAGNAESPGPGPISVTVVDAGLTQSEPTGEPGLVETLVGTVTGLLGL